MGRWRGCCLWGACAHNGLWFLFSPHRLYRGKCRAQQNYDKVIWRDFPLPILNHRTQIILASGGAATVTIIQEVHCPLKSKEETNQLSIYFYLMLWGFCFQLWRVLGKGFLKSLIPGCSWSWSLAHCVYLSCVLSRDAGCGKEGTSGSREENKGA